MANHSFSSSFLLVFFWALFRWIYFLFASIFFIIIFALHLKWTSERRLVVSGTFISIWCQNLLYAFSLSPSLDCLLYFKKHQSHPQQRPNDVNKCNTLNFESYTFSDIFTTEFAQIRMKVQIKLFFGWIWIV